MNKHNYIEEMTHDVLYYLKNEKCITCRKEIADYDREELEQDLYDELWCEDSVTGNASGSYTFSRELSKNYVLGNMELCTESLKEFCIESETVAKKFLSEDWEYFDVTIRCYLLGQAICNALDKIENR